MSTQIRVQTQESLINTSQIVFLDLADNQPISADYQFKDIQSFKNTKGNYTYNFRIPSTTNNNVFFGDYFEVTSFGNYNPKIKVEATITKDTIDVFNGYLQLTNVFTSNNEISSYECVVFSSVATIGQILDSLMLSDFDWSEYNHILTPQNVQDSMNRDAVGLFNGDIVYSLFDYGAQFIGGNTTSSCTNQNSSGVATNPINIRNLKPQIKVQKVLQKIILDSGFTYESTFFDTTMTDLYMDINSGGAGNTTLTDPNFYRIDVQGEFNTGGTFPASVGVHTIIPNNLLPPSGQPDFMNASGQFDTTTGIYSPSGNWNLSAFGAQVGLSSSGLQIEYTFGLFNITDNIFTQFETDIQTLNNGTQQSFLGGFNPNFINTFESGKQYKLIVTILSTSSPTSTITILASAFRNTPASDGYVGVSPNSGNLNITPYDATTEYSVNANLPNVKALDFLTSLTKKFNLIIVPDELQPTHLYIEPYSEWIEKGNSVNWTEKIDVSKDIQIKPTVDLQAKNLSFTDASSEDFMNSMFKASTDRIYGTQNIDNSENDFGKDKEEIKTIFKPTITSQIPDTPIRYSVAYNQENENVTCEPGIRLSFYCGFILTDSNDGVQIYSETPEATSSLSLTSYGLLQNYKDAVILPATECLSFMSEYTGSLASPISMNSAYFVYWKNFIDETYSINARLLIASFYLSSLDILSMNFNDIIFVKNEYFRINKISNYPLIGTSTCQVELIKVARINKFDKAGNDCAIEPSFITSNGGVVNFISTLGGFAVIPTQSCCEAFGYTYANGVCTQVFSGGGVPDSGGGVSDPSAGGGGNKGFSGDSLSLDTSSLLINNTIKGLNEVSGSYNNIHGPGNAIQTNHSNVNGFFNFIKTDSVGNSIKGDSNAIDSNTKYSIIEGSNNLLNPYSLNYNSTYLDVYSRQKFKNNSIQGDYAIALGNGEEFISGGADPLYNKRGRSGSGQFVKHCQSRNKEDINIGQNGIFIYSTLINNEFFTEQATNLFRLEFPSIIGFEVSVVGHERGVVANRSQLYSFRIYKGVINNTTNSGNVSIRNLTLDTQKESSEFSAYNFNVLPGQAYFDGQYVDDGMFYFNINMTGADALSDVDWTIDFKYTLVGLQNIDRPSNQRTFSPPSISGCLLWVDSNQPATITHSGGAISQWDDLSGNNHHLTQSTSAYKPVYSQSIADSYVSFSGVNQVLGNQASTLINASDGDNTIFVVFKSDNTTTSTRGETIAGICNRAQQLYGININNSVSGAGGSSFMNKSSQDYGNRVSIIPSTTKQVVIGTRSSVTREIFDQDGNTDSDNNSSNTAQDTFVVGATWDGTSRSPVADYSGKVYEVIVYGVKLTEAQRNQVQNYLQTKWNT